MAIDLTELEEAVETATTTADSLIAYTEGIKDQLHAELAGDPQAQAKVDLFMAQLIASKEKMAAAMQANVPPAAPGT